MAHSSNNSRHELKDILSLLMDECDIDDAQLSRETGIPASTISRMRINSDTNPTAATLRPIAKYFSVSISQLLGDEDLPKNRLPGFHNPNYYTSSRMPVIKWDWIISWLENRCEDNKEKLTHWISTEKEVSSDTFALIIPTDSYGLAFRKGSFILIDPRQEPRDGDLILIQNSSNSQLTLKQLILDDNKKYIRSVNPELKNISLLEENYKILGVMIETRFSLSDSFQPTAQNKTIKRQSIFAKTYKLKPI